MDYPYLISFLPIIMLFIIIFVTQRNEKLAIKNILSKKTEDRQMFELAKKFIGRECIIYTFNSAQYTGTVTEVNEGGLLLEKEGAIEALNFDYIVRIREYPRNKNGKKRSVILD